jgi:hypothetical protein
MPVVNLNNIVQHASNLMQTRDMSESKAIDQAIENSGISEEEAKEIKLKEQVKVVLNRDTEQEKKDAEEQLNRQREDGFKDVNFLNNETDTSDDEADLQDTPTDE